jgi:hypothetical protein
MHMKLFGKDIGYDDPFFYFGAWEFGVFDNGWILAKNRVIRHEGRWPTYWTFHRKAKP